MVYIILGQGFEEAEAIVPMDILRRGGADVKFAAVKEKSVTGAYNITIECDITVDKIIPEKADMIVIPGGLDGVKSIKNSKIAMSKISESYKLGKILAAICAGPTVFGELGIMEGVHAVCYPGMENQVKDAIFARNLDSACRDGNIITGRGPGTAYEFGFELLKALKGANVVKAVRQAMAC